MAQAGAAISPEEDEDDENRKEKDGRVRLSIEKLQVYDNADGVKLRQKQGTDFLRWAVAHQAVTASALPVPEGILPSPYGGRLHELRVYSKARGPDDAIYDAHADMRERLARGNLILELTDGPESGHYTVLRALRKFTGGEVWDDDDRCDVGAGDPGQKDAWQRYFSASVADAKLLVSTKKANGEAAHLSAFKVAGQWLLVCGSKNTHLVVRDKGDIDRYSGDRFRVARMFAEHILDAVKDLTETQRRRLLKFLWRHSLTAVFEILMQDHQHVEDLSSIGRPAVLKFIAWTPNEGGVSFTALPVDVGLKVARKFGLDPTGYSSMDPEQLNLHMTNVLRMYGHEGAVLYFLDEDDRTIGLLKKKTAWYVLCRATREKAKAAVSAWRRDSSRFSLAAQHKKIERRFAEIESWLKLPPEVTLRWINLANGFLDFCIRDSRTNILTMNDVANLFPIVWRRYLNERGADDHVFDEQNVD